MMTTIVMTYFDRQRQLDRTLDSLRRYDASTFNVVIVDDGSPQDVKLQSYPFVITLLKLTNKQWTNPEPVYNTGLKFALIGKPDIIMLQNAECYHAGDVLGYARTNLRQDNYITFGCYSIDEPTTFSEHNIADVIAKADHSITANGTNGWYNHPQHRPRALEFCSAITRENMLKLNGYDERLALGCWYGDDYLLARIRMLGLQVVITDYPYVVHQWHANSQAYPNAAALIEKNRVLFGELVAQGDYRAKHIFTLNL